MKINSQFPRFTTNFSNLALVVSFARSFDNNVKSAIVKNHLVSNSCYIDFDLYMNAINDHVRKPDWDPDWVILHVYKTKINVIDVPFESYAGLKKNNFKYIQFPSLIFFDREFLHTIFFPETNLEYGSPLPSLKKCIFVFNGFVWSELQIIFRELDISISGGSVSKRHQLKSVSFYLSKFLLDLDIDAPVLYESLNLSKFIENNSKFLDLNLFRESMLNIMHDNLSAKLLVLREKLCNLESLVVKTKSLLETANQKTNKYNKDPAKFALKKSLEVQSIKAELNQYLEEINLVESQIKIEEKELNDVNNCSLKYF